eukprot:8626732-Prorocentrum_lima.AAC.1
MLESEASVPASVTGRTPPGKPAPSLPAHMDQTQRNCVPGPVARVEQAQPTHARGTVPGGSNVESM